ncbi:MAG: heavy metal-responsive transcriptional regulator [Cyanobacteria bacterium J06623_7]
MEKTSYFKIGNLAHQTGLTVGTIRYYSDLGLLPPAVRGDNGYRYYSHEAIDRVCFIKKAQAIGFSLEEIAQIIQIRDRGETPCSLVQTLLTDKIEQIEAQIEQMNLFKRELEAYKQAWRNNPQPDALSSEVCPLIASVSFKEK